MYESVFFPGVRRKFTLLDYRQLKTKADEKRKKLSISGELGPDNSLVGMPSFIGDPYDLLARGELAGDYAVDRNLKLEGMTLEVWATDISKKRTLLLTGCTFKKFAIVKEGMDDKALFYFTFIAYVPDSIALHEWCRGMFSNDFFARFDHAQGDLPLEAPPATTDEGINRIAAMAKQVAEDDDEDDDDDDTVDEEEDDEFEDSPATGTVYQ